MDAKAAGADTQRGQPVSAGEARSNTERVRKWMETTVRHIGQGEQSVQAFTRVLRVATVLASESAAPQALVHFKEMLQNRLEEEVAAAECDLLSLLGRRSFTVEELLSIFTECAATEANLSQSNKVDPSVKLHLQEASIFDEIDSIRQDHLGTSYLAETGGCELLGASIPEDIFSETGKSNFQSNSILAETGRNQIVHDAVLDASTFICTQCWGVISTRRKEDHLASWCSKKI